MIKYTYQYVGKFQSKLYIYIIDTQTHKNMLHIFLKN